MSLGQQALPRPTLENKSTLPGLFIEARECCTFAHDTMQTARQSVY